MEKEKVEKVKVDENAALKETIKNMANQFEVMQKTIDSLQRGETQDVPDLEQLAMEARGKKERALIDEKRVAAFTGSIYVTNPDTQQKFYPNHVTERVLVDSWVLSQVDAGILIETKVE